MGALDFVSLASAPRTRYANKEKMMAYVQPASMRSTVIPEPNGIKIVIPAKRNWFILLFLSFWLCGWAVGEFTVPFEFLKNDTPSEAILFSLAWLGMWTVGGGFAIYAWLWQVKGQEIITLTPTALLIKRSLFGYGRQKEYGVQHLKNLRVAAQGFNPFDFSSAGQFWGISGGTIAFDYGAKTYRFGVGLDESEANQLVSQMKQLVRIAD
jgi:hypothetical protein